MFECLQSFGPLVSALNLQGGWHIVVDIKQRHTEEVFSQIIMGCTGNKVQGDNSVSLGVGNRVIEYRVTQRKRE